MFERILYAAELGDGTPRSFDYVKDIALDHDSEVVVLRVGEVAGGQIALARKREIDVESAAEDAEARARVEGQLASADVAAALRDAGVFARTVVRAGRIAEEILAVADEIDADIIIVGSAPRTVLKALLTGSVTDEIVRRARRPVLVVPSLGPDESENAAPGDGRPADPPAA